MDRTELEETIVDYLSHHYGGTLSTVRDDGTPQASGISYVSDGLLLYFGMDPESQKRISAFMRKSIQADKPFYVAYWPNLLDFFPKYVNSCIFWIIRFNYLINIRKSLLQLNS